MPGQGLIPDVPDGRDYPYAVARSLAPPAVAVPAERIVKWRGPTLDQGASSACAAFAGVGLKVQQEGLEHRGYFAFDPHELYDRCKLRDGFPGEQGTTLRAVCEELAGPGLVPMRWRRGPVPDARRHPYRVRAYLRIETVGELVDALAHSGPVMLGLSPITDDWLRPVRPGFGRWLGFPALVPSPRGAPRGGHAVLVVGYRQAGRLLLVRNSWGAGWGARGYAWLDSHVWLRSVRWDAWRCIDERDPLGRALDR